MPRFVYRTTRTMPPRPGVTYSTVYYKQSPEEHARMTAWLTGVAEQIFDRCLADPDTDSWFTTPHKRFRKSTRGQYYTPEELLTRMLEQLIAGNDLPDAMIGRWNRLCVGTEWEIEMTDQAVPTPAFHALFA